ncbi:hypothetical protein FHG64_07490 [Antarcticibacterium flavum]|uniref:DUF4369 domain-containing protein n=1 Tax=Antarcticibacterium flavum TaxID=2058175 RepID=A0A5B7X1V1_9FLAO|nr:MULTISPECIES: hypothetical protein [Antarcticibacterium]MCM4161030.1 hypothetical protein [Antarcticibacterium sp. W02-3]QCY69250.1 hypothetical protein FHG64_07490 [Antarcticibacterium flavum]
MRKIFVLFIGGLLISSGNMFAQIPQDGGLHTDMLIQTRATNEFVTYEGTPYLEDNFKPGTFTIEGKEPTNAFLRYNVVTEEMEIKTDYNGEVTYLLPTNKNIRYQLGPNEYVFRNLRVDGNLLKGYFVEHYVGEKVSLVEKLIASTTEPMKAQTAYQKDKPAQIVMEEKYFLILENGEVQEVKLKTKDFTKALPNSRAVKNYLSNNKVKTIEDYKKLLQWYEEQA